MVWRQREATEAKGLHFNLLCAKTKTKLGKIMQSPRARLLALQEERTIAYETWESALRGFCQSGASEEPYAQVLPVQSAPCYADIRDMGVHNHTLSKRAAGLQGRHSSLYTHFISDQNRRGGAQRRGRRHGRFVNVDSQASGGRAEQAAANHRHACRAQAPCRCQGSRRSCRQSGRPSCGRASWRGCSVGKFQRAQRSAPQCVSLFLYAGVDPGRAGRAGRGNGTAAGGDCETDAD